MQRELKDGLILRSLDDGTESDRAHLGKFYEETFAGEGDEDAVELLAWVEDLLSDDHPQTALQDFWVVVDPAQDDRIVSAILHIPQTWRYGGQIDLNAGRIELVATDKEYRNRGLIRAQFEAAHARCESLGQVIQGITGIPHYYRRFGYAMTVDLGSAGWLPFGSIPKLKDDESPAFTLRDATEDDIPQMMAWYERSVRDTSLADRSSAAVWRFDLMHRSADTPMHNTYKVIVDQSGRGVGYVAYNLGYTFGRLSLNQYVVGPESSYLATFDDVIRALEVIGRAHTGTNKQSPDRIYMNNVLPEAVHQLVRGSRGHLYQSPYAWYIRVADVSRLLKQIGPVLEARLEDSAAHRYTGEMTVGFHTQQGIKFHFEDGKIKDVTTEELYWADAAFPYDQFLSVVFGHRDIFEISYILPDTYANKKAQTLLAAMFPKQHAALLGLA